MKPFKSSNKFLIRALFKISNLIVKVLKNLHLMILLEIIHKKMLKNSQNYVIVKFIQT
jgi:hypothetical protein